MMPIQRCVSFFLLLLLLCGGTAWGQGLDSRLPPTSVEVWPTLDATYKPWRLGQVNVSFVASTSSNVTGYSVFVDPMLSYTLALNSSGDLQDLVYTPGAPGHNNSIVGLNSTTSTFDICYASGNRSWHEPRWGRGYMPMALRKVPDAMFVSALTLNCAQIPSGGVSLAMCGLVVYDAGANRPLISWMV